MSEEEVHEITYIPLSGDIGPEDIFSQSAQALDLAALFAFERKDIEGMAKVAREWTRLGAALAGIEEVPEEQKKKIINFGFNKEIVEEEKDDKSDSESDGKDDIQSQGRLHSYRIRSRRSGP